MPNRLIREGWVDSEKIDSLSSDGERFFLRLLLKADDFGRYTANSQLLKSSLFPLKDGIRNTDMTRLLAECEKAGLVRCYEHASKRYCVIDNFQQRTRAMASKYPDPEGDDGHMSDTCLTDDSHMTARVSSPSPSPSSGEGVQGKPENGSFSEFLRAGPSRWLNDEYKASQAWLSAVTAARAQGIDVAQIIQRAAAYRTFCDDEGRTGSHIHRPQNWLNGEEWRTDWDAMERTAGTEAAGARQSKKRSEAVQRDTRQVLGRIEASKRDSAAPEEIGAVMGDIAKNLLRGGKPCTT